MPQNPDWFSQFEEPKSDYFSQFEEVPKGKEVPEEPSLLEKGLNLVTEAPKFITDAADELANKIDQPTLTGSKLGAQIKGFGAGAIQGASKLLSPLNIASTIAPESRLATALYGAQGLEGANEIRKGNYLQGAADIGMGALGALIPGMKGKNLKEAVLPREAEVMPNEEIPIPSQKQLPLPQKQLGPGVYHVSPSEDVQLPNSRVRMDTGKFARGSGTAHISGEVGVETPTDIPIRSMRERLQEPKTGLFRHNPTDIEGVVTTKEDFKLEPQIKQAEVVSEVPNSVPSDIPEVKVRGPAQEYIDAVKSGKIDRTTSFTDFQANKESLMSRFVKEEKGTFEPFKIFKKVRGVDDAEANKVRESVIDSLIQGGRIDLEGIYGKTIGMNRKQFNKIVDEIIDTGAAPKIAEQIKVNTPEPIQRLLGALSESKINSALQAAQLSAERGQRFGKFSSALNQGEGKEGFFKAASQMSGEYGKVSPTELKLGQADTDSLFEQIKNNTRITPAEKLRAGFAVRDLLEGTRVLQRNELQLMDRIYGPGIGNQIMMMHGGLGGVGIKLSKTANTMKSMNATLDLSAPFRQGLGLVHRGEFWDAYMKMFKYAGSHEAFMAQEAAMESHPNYLLSRDAGLFTADHELGNFEEQFGNSYLNDIRNSGKVGKLLTEPAAASERAYVGFLNKLRFDTFNSLISKAEKAGLETFKIGADGSKISTPLSKEIANYVNVSTGRGNLGKVNLGGRKEFDLNQLAEPLNTLLFSPRLIASRLTVLNPMYYINANPFVRKEALKTLFALGGFVGIANGIGSVLGGSSKLLPTQKNLTNPDYGKIKWNNTRLDPGGGLLQYIVAASQFVAGQATSSTGNNTYDTSQFGQQGRVGKLIGIGNPRANSFLENKMSPMASLIDTIISGKIDPNTKKKYNIPTEVGKRFVPLITQDMYDIYQKDPELMGLGIPASMGMGLQTYGGAASGGMRAPSIGNLK